MASRLELTVDGVRSPVTDLGPRAGEAVVFVHGNPGSRLDWSELGTATSQFARLGLGLEFQAMAHLISCSRISAAFLARGGR